jgi:enoyl-CoA hydratase
MPRSAIVLNQDSHVIYEERGALAFVCLNRPHKRNALTRQMLERLREIFAGITARRDLRVVILTGGMGTDAFSAGTDIAELAALDKVGAHEAARRGQSACEAIELCSAPVIAAINGVAAGGGLELALACHLRIATTQAAFSLPELKLGLIPAYGATQRLARIIGEGRALEMMLTPNTCLSPEEALRIGLINRVCEPAGLLEEAEALAREIMQLAPLTIRACLEAVTRGQTLTLEKGLALEAELFSGLFATNDMREGTRAFLEKRQPVFKGQ